MARDLYIHKGKQREMIILCYFMCIDIVKALDLMVDRYFGNKYLSKDQP